MASNERFGYEWHKYSAIDPNYELQFRNWISPLSESDFKGRVVLDAGCGMGRNSYWPLRWGADRVVAFDFDQRSVAATKKNLVEFANAEVLFKSIYDLNWYDQFDLAFSIGVIHHLKDPKLALRKLVESLKPGGVLLVWVYSYEGNQWVVKLVDPVRKIITSRLPIALVHFLSYFCSIPLWLFVKTFWGLNGYLKQLAGFKFWHLHSIVFDQLIPEVANYWSREEVEKLFSNIGLKNFNIYRPLAGNGWTIIGRV